MKKNHISSIFKKLRAVLGDESGPVSQDWLARKADVSVFAIQKAEQSKGSGPDVLIAVGTVAPPPLCWDFFEAAGLSKAVIVKKQTEERNKLQRGSALVKTRLKKFNANLTRKNRKKGEDAG